MCTTQSKLKPHTYMATIDRSKPDDLWHNDVEIFHGTKDVEIFHGTNDDTVLQSAVVGWQSYYVCKSSLQDCRFSIVKQRAD